MVYEVECSRSLSGPSKVAPKLWIKPRPDNGSSFDLPVVNSNYLALNHY